MKADLVAKITDDLASFSKDQDAGGEHVVTELTPQAKLLAEMAKQAALKPVVGDWDIKPHPLLAAAAPTREQFDAEDTAPVVIMRNPIAGKQAINGCTDLDQPVPINAKDPMTLDTPLFQGTISVQIRNLKSTDNKYFNGKKRFTHLVMQGRLKHDVAAADLWTGHEWFQVPDLVPTSFISIGYTAAAKMFSSTTRVCPSTSNGQVAGFLNPVLASCQLVHVARVGEEPDPWEAVEDMRLLSPELADKNGDPLPAEKRRRWFDNPANASSVLLSKDYVYTWHIWQHWCNIATYRLQLSSFFSIDLCQFSEGQPMQIMAKDSKTGEYSVNLLLWHKHLLYHEEHTSMKEKLSSITASMKGLLKGRH